MIERPLGAGGPLVGALGLGCMGMSEFYAPVAERDASAAIEHALALGMTLLDTADLYGSGANEALVGRALRGRRAGAVVATKGGLLRRADDPDWRGTDGSSAYLRAACDASLARLGIEAIDLYYLHRPDPAVPIEESVGALAELRARGKIRAIGLSEISVEQLRRAVATAPIAALQSEYSLFTRDLETNGILDATRELGIALVAYAPLGRGMLTGTVRSRAAFDERDLRRRVPRFDADNLDRNLSLVDRLAAHAAAAGLSPAQAALAWVLSRGEHVIALPGCERVEQVEHNAVAASAPLDPALAATLDELFPPGAAAGGRFRR